MSAATTTPPTPTPAPPPAQSAVRRVLFAAAAVLCLTPWVTPPVALAAGIGFALVGLSAFPAESRKGSKLLIQVCVVLLGLSMDFHGVVRAGLTGCLFAAGTIAATFTLGHLLGRALGTDGKITALVSSGTAICGGSAIAATGSAINASPAQMSVAIGTVFVLNSVALFLFPYLGRGLGLDPTQFGTWAAVAIHDVSSVVGAGAAFDASWNTAHGVVQSAATDTAVAVKLARTLWIVPVALLAAFIVRRAEPELHGKRAFPVPWFIGLFVLAAAAATWLPPVAEVGGPAKLVAKAGMALALFLIGSSLNRAAVAAVGWRPMALGLVLWVFISVAALLTVQSTLV